MASPRDIWAHCVLKSIDQLCQIIWAPLCCISSAGILHPWTSSIEHSSALVTCFCDMNMEIALSHSDIYGESLLHPAIALIIFFIGRTFFRFFDRFSSFCFENKKEKTKTKQRKKPKRLFVFKEKIENWSNQKKLILEISFFLKSYKLLFKVI